MMRFAGRRAAWAILTGALAALAAFSQKPAGTLELHFLNRTVEEGTWFSAHPSATDLKPLCGQIEIHAIYSGEADALSLWIDGALVDERQATDARFVWDTKGWPDTEHQVTIQALAGDGKIRDSFSLVLESRTETDTTPPEVSISFPPDHSVVRGVIEVKATARDDHDVARVWLDVDGNHLQTKKEYPYTFSWDTRSLPNGSEHTLQVKAEDGSGNEGSSDPVTVQVSNPKALLKNPSLQGVPPSSWRSLGNVRFLPERRGGVRLLPSPGGKGPQGVEQQFALDAPADGALLAIVLRAEYKPSDGQQPACPFRAEILDDTSKDVFSWDCPGQAAGYASLTELALPLPHLAKGAYTVRFTAAPCSQGEAFWEIAKADVLVP